MAATGLGFAQHHVVLAVARRRGARHAQPVGRRRQRVPARPSRRSSPRTSRRRSDRGCSRRTTSPAIWAGAIGALLSGVPECARAARRLGRRPPTQRASFVLYAVVRRRHLLRLPPADTRDGDVLRPGLAHGARAACCRTLAPHRARARRACSASTPPAAVSSSRRCSCLWLHLRFDLSAGATGAVFFAAGCARRLLAVPRAPARGPLRAHPHDGVHAHARPTCCSR